MDETNAFPDDGETTESATASVPKDRRAVVLSFLALGLIALFTIFALQNSESVEVEVFAWTFSMSRIFLMLFSLIVGIVGTMAIGFLRRR